MLDYKDDSKDTETCALFKQEILLWRIKLNKRAIDLEGL